MKQYEISAIKAGEYGPVGENVIFDDGDGNVTHMLPSIIYHLQCGEESIVVDASFSDAKKCDDIMGATAWSVAVKRDGSLDDVLLANGVDPQKVSKVILTHAHWDHAGGAAVTFPNATIYLQKIDWDYMLASDAIADVPFADEREAMLDRLVLVPEHFCDLDGIEMLKVGGHTPGSQLVFVDTHEGRAVIAGDVVMSQRNIERNMPIGLSMNPAEARHALDVVIQSGCKCYCGHEMPLD